LHNSFQNIDVSAALSSQARFDHLMLKLQQSIRDGNCSREMEALFIKNPNAFRENPKLLEKADVIRTKKRLVPFLYCHTERRLFHAKYNFNISLHDTERVFMRSCYSVIERGQSGSGTVPLLPSSRNTTSMFNSSFFSSLERGVASREVEEGSNSFTTSSSGELPTSNFGDCNQNDG
jgi:hypothetical protein